MLLHSKTALIDGVWSTVGSTNLDWRSFLHNQEVNAVILGPDFGAQMRASFDRDLAASTPITLEAVAAATARRPAEGTGRPDVGILALIEGTLAATATLTPGLPIGQHCEAANEPPQEAIDKATNEAMNETDR